MCGVIGVIGEPGQRQGRSLHAGLDALAKRGPDGRGTFTSRDASVQLGHTRLAIVDIEGGAQPLHNESGDVHAIVNGELYDDISIRRSLEARGHRFETKSDSELIVHLYEEHTMHLVDHLAGEFAFVLYDEREKRLVAARDRFGIKPLVYAQHHGALYIASEAKALFALGVPAMVDRTSLLHALCHQYLPEGRTFFEGVRSVPPGHRLIYQAGTLRIERYWDTPMPSPGHGSAHNEQEAISVVRELLTRAVTRRLRADVPVGVYLSGGLDSSLIAALSTQSLGRAPRCFNIGFDGAGYDESELAQTMARHLGAELTTVQVNAKTTIERLRDAVICSEGLAINAQLTAKHALSAAVHQAGLKVVLTGEGADEAFFGYPHIALDAGVATAGRADAAAGAVMMPSQARAGSVGVHERFVPSFVRAKLEVMQQVRPCMRGDVLDELEALDLETSFKASIDGLQERAKHSRAAASSYAWSKTCLAGYILRTLGDGTEMAHSVEGRPPFLDRELFELASSLPDTLKLRDESEKWVLREAARGLLPEEVRTRPKHPLLAPPLLGDDEARDFVFDMLGSEDFDALGVFDLVESRSLFERTWHADMPTRARLDPVLFTLLSATAMSSWLRGLSS